MKNFYLVPDTKILKGTLHVLIKFAESIELNIRGIFASKQGDRWIFRMIYKNAKDKNGVYISYPVLSFSNSAINKELLNEIYEKAPVFIENCLTANLHEFDSLNATEEVKSKVKQPKRKEDQPSSEFKLKSQVSSQAQEFETVVKVKARNTPRAAMPFDFVNPPARKPLQSKKRI